MKRTVFYIALCILLCLANGTVFGQEEQTEIKPRKMLFTIDDEVFTRIDFTQDFSEAQGYVNELPTQNSVHQYFIYKGRGTDMLLSLLPSEETIRTTNKRLTFDQARKDAFHVTYKVQQTEDMPPKAGGKCWIRYSNVILAGKGKESGLILYPGDKAYYFTPVDGEMTYEVVADLSSLKPDKENKFDFIRLDGKIYVYANSQFLFEYEDGIKEAVSFESGSELQENGIWVRCDFDDFTMRTK